MNTSQSPFFSGSSTSTKHWGMWIERFLIPNIRKVALRMRADVMQLICLAVLGFGVAPAGQAQSFPDKPLRWIVGFPAASGLDFVNRMVADSMSKNLGHSIAVDNRPGATGGIAVGGVTSAPRDGYISL